MLMHGWDTCWVEQVSINHEASLETCSLRLQDSAEVIICYGNGDGTF